MNRNINFIPFSRPSISVEEEAAVLAVLRSGWLTTGKEARQFEEEFAAFTGARYCLAVNSATAGLHLSLEALQVQTGTCVITTPYTFTASAETARYMGADPLFIDIEEKSFNMDPVRLEEALKKYRGRVSAILPVHIGGLPCAMEEICALGDAYGVPVVEDAAHAFPVKFKGRYIGTYGKTGVYSFYANKTITTGEGGMVATDDEKVADRIRIMRLHGLDRESWDRYININPSAAWYYQVVAPGYKYNLTDLAAAIGRQQLKKAELFLEKRRRIAGLYFEGLADCDFLVLPERAEEHAWHLFMLRLVPGKLQITRDEFIVKLQQAGIGTAVHYIPLHIMPYYSAQYGLAPEDFPVALRNYLNCFSLPLYPDLPEAAVEYIIRTIRQTGYDTCRKQMIKGRK